MSFIWPNKELKDRQEGDKYRKERAKVITPRVIPSRDHGQEVQRGVGIEQCEEKASALLKRRSLYCWDQARNTLG